MSTELIINATLPETRIALLEDNEVQELHIERDSERGIVGNIYKGKVIRVLPGMQAAFVDIGLEKAAFLYVDDIFFPDMKTPLHTSALPEGPIVVPERAPRSEQPGGRQGRRGRGRDRGVRQGRPSQTQDIRPGQAGDAEPQTLPVAPVSPEDHARLQVEYARQMLSQSSDGVSLLGEPNETTVLAAEGAPEVVAAGADPRDGELDQPEARAPLVDDEDDGDEPEASVVYRAEPLIDAEAWADDIAEVESQTPVVEANTEARGEAVSEGIASVAGEAEPGAGESLGVEDAEGLVAEGANSADDPNGAEGVAPVSPVLPLPLSGTGGTRALRGDSGVEREDREDDEDSAEMPRRRRRREPVNIADIVKEGQEILVQVAKDPIGTKGARLTCHVSLPGRYLVFMPTVDHIGVSRRIESEGERRRLKETMNVIRPAKTGVIVRTASGKQTDKKLKADLDYLVTTWNDIQRKFNKQRTPSPVYQDLTIVLRAIRDMFTDEVDKVVVDSKREHRSIMKFVTRFIPHVKDKIELYEHDVPIFDYYGIEQEIARSLERKVWLKSGGYLVIDQAEALVAIDVNTGRYVGKKTLEETILKTNLEAVKEIAYQLRLRNCGGIIILDLIDMEKDANKDKVYKALEEAIKKDRSRPTIMKISQLGLIEMTRKRTRDSLVRSLCEPCSYCEGKGYVKNKLTIAHDIMRDLEREGVERDTSAISIQCHPSVADVLLEDKRDVLEDLERQFDKKITIRGNGAYHVEQYELVAHRESKNMVWSSEERRQLVRQKAQERAQHVAAEQRKKDNEERERRRKEQEDARLKAQAEREERRKQMEALREQRRQQLEAARVEAEARKQALLDGGADPAALNSEDFEVREEKLAPLLGPDGQPVTLAALDRLLDGASGDQERGGRRRRRRGRRGRTGRDRAEQPRSGEQQQSRGGGNFQQQRQPRDGQRSSQQQRPPQPRHQTQSRRDGGEVEQAAGGPPVAPIDGSEQTRSQAQATTGGDAGGAGGMSDNAGQRRRRRGRRGGRRHRFRRRGPEAGGPPPVSGPAPEGGGNGGHE